MKPPSGKVKKQLLSFIKDLLIALIVVILITTFFMQNQRVKGNSMYPTLVDGDMVILNKWVYSFNDPEIGDIIGFYSPKIDQSVVKRIIAKEGDIVDYNDEMFFVNDKPISSNPQYVIKNKGDIDYPYEVPNDTYFVIGDNYENSIDSRYHYIGPVIKENIIGRIKIRIWPVWLNPFLK